ncbi:MAG: adenosylcobinamide-GDP ribazoletransferase [Spirochaetia bacterium]|nr:adenosylcobinamide-GDP ribazoletransferase [Spirochaetia bacterium]
MVAYKKFGGITGDIAGWFLQLSELATILCIGLFG